MCGVALGTVGWDALIPSLRNINHPSHAKKASVGNSLDRSEPLSRIPLRQYRIILSADTASEVRQLPERCLSRKAGIVRCCPNCGLQKLAPRAVRHLFVAVIASIISYASRVSTDILTNIMQASLRCCSRFFSLPLFLPILLHFIQAFPLTCLHSHLLSQGLSEIKKAAASNLPAAAYLIIIALPDVPLRFISITLRCHPGYLPQKHPSSFRCATYLFHLFPWRQPSAVVPGRSLWCRSGSARVLQ